MDSQPSCRKSTRATLATIANLVIVVAGLSAIVLVICGLAGIGPGRPADPPAVETPSPAEPGRGTDTDTMDCDGVLLAELRDRLSGVIAQSNRDRSRLHDLESQTSHLRSGVAGHQSELLELERRVDPLELAGPMPRP
jgi:hypothetical protein